MLFNASKSKMSVITQSARLTICQWIGRSSCWDELGTFTNRLASVTCCHCLLCSFLSMQNGFTRHAIAKVVS
eukprot:154850-Pleurochrysis_carterae.AAC.1